MNRALATSTCVLLMTLLLVVAVSGYHQPTLVTIANQTNGFNFPNVQLASTTVYEGKYYAIQDMTNELIEVDPETLNMTLSIQIPSLYTSYTMGGAARIMLTPNLVVVSTRVIGGMSGNVGWTAGFNRFTFDQVWNISMLANMGDVPTFTVVGDNIFFTANNFTNFNEVFVIIRLSDGHIVKSIDMGNGNVIFLGGELAALFVNDAYNAKYIEVLNLRTLVPKWRVASPSVEQFYGFTFLAGASDDYVIVSNQTVMQGANVSLYAYAIKDGTLVHIMHDVPVDSNINYNPTFDFVSSPSTVLFSYFVNNSFMAYHGLEKQAPFTEKWAATINISAEACQPVNGDTLVTLDYSHTLTIHNYTTGFHSSISGLLWDNMSYYPQLWLYTPGVIMLPIQVDEPYWTAGFVLYNASSGAFMGNMSFASITYDTLWSQTPTYALQYAPNRFLIDNVGTLYQQMFA